MRFSGRDRSRSRSSSRSSSGAAFAAGAALVIPLPRSCVPFAATPTAATCTSWRTGTTLTRVARSRGRSSRVMERTWCTGSRSPRMRSARRRSTCICIRKRSRRVPPRSGTLARWLRSSAYRSRSRSVPAVSWAARSRHCSPCSSRAVRWPVSVRPIRRRRDYGCGRRSYRASRLWPGSLWSSKSRLGRARNSFR